MQKIGKVLKAVLASYIITGLLLLLLTFLVYQFQIEETFIEMGITGTYLISTFIGGVIVGKLIGKRRFAWGILLGIVYIGLLYGISYGVYGEIDIKGLENMKPVFLCIGGGMLGGMLS